MIDLPNPEANDWYGKRASGPKWSDEFLSACLTSGAIVEYGKDITAAGAWARVLAVIGFLLTIVAVATYALWWPR